MPEGTVDLPPGPSSALCPDTSSLGRADEERLVHAARDTRPVEGLTHRHYRYPARFSPVLAAAVIDVLSEPGDLVGDPFVGGGTTLVEALAARRRAWGVDISTLASFVTSVKTLVLSDPGVREFEFAMASVVEAISMTRPEPEFTKWSEAGYLRHLDDPSHWRVRKAMAQAIAEISSLQDARVEALARCTVLRTTQWALEARRRPPSIEQFRDGLRISAETIAQGARDFARAAVGAETPVVLARPCQGVEGDPRVAGLGTPRLLLTSPPYPGVHVLYHRWQVGGRRETPAPFFIANTLDGSGNNFYTMGGRRRPGLPGYFADLELSLRSMAALSNESTTLVQIVAFAQPEWQLPRYLEAVAHAGWREFRLGVLTEARDGRLWRTVPNRKWYADQRGTTSSAQEVVLFHRLG